MGGEAEAELAVFYGIEIPETMEPAPKKSKKEDREAKTENNEVEEQWWTENFCDSEDDESNVATCKEAFKSAHSKAFGTSETGETGLRLAILQGLETSVGEYNNLCIVEHSASRICREKLRSGEVRKFVLDNLKDFRKLLEDGYGMTMGDDKAPGWIVAGACMFYE
mmetsp:Transcript_5920/g.10712  ORF Transcript_5920/g.10712 Transcript_5920/m.10712 type:complete len:166 (+) Transcript_5920:712-1209(+)